MSMNMGYLRESMKGSILHKIYQQKMDPNNICTVRDMKDMDMFKSHFFLLTTFHEFVLHFIVSMRPESDMFVSDRTLSSLNMVFLFPKKIDKNLRQQIQAQW